MQTEAKRSERAFWIFSAVVVAVRLVFIFVHQIDSDEPQHLHVVWGWSQGLVPYRDVFDNHLPLLHLLFAPLLGVLPESSSVFLIMRLAMAPLALAAAWLLFKLGEPLIGRRDAIFAALLFCVLPPWLPKSIEFRNDTLWIVLWLAAMVLLVARRTPAYFMAGLASGLCFLASVKAMPLLIAHAMALICCRQAVRPKHVVRFALGAAIPLLALVALLYSRGALDAMIYATQNFNAAFPVPISRRLVRGALFLLITPLFLVWARDERRELSPLTRHLILFTLWYSFVVYAFWPIISPRDYLPLVPLAALVIASFDVARRAPAAVFATAVLAAVWYAQLWKPRDLSRHQFVDAVAQMTAPDDYVYDLKGDAIFRPRTLYPIYDKVGRTLTTHGLLPDHGPEEIVSHGCLVAIPDSSFIPARTRAFLNDHFVDFGGARVSGATVRGGRFTIAVPQTYAVIAHHPSGVTIDGVGYHGPRFLTAGEHTLTKGEPNPVTVVWSGAVSGKLDTSVWSRINSAPPSDRRLASELTERE